MQIENYYAVTVWSIEDLEHLDFKNDDERKNFMKRIERSLHEAMVETGWYIINGSYADYKRGML